MVLFYLGIASFVDLNSNHVHTGERHAGDTETVAHQIWPSLKPPDKSQLSTLFMCINSLSSVLLYL